LVSIPVGFFQALQRRLLGVLSQVEEEFQSLSGFFRPCNEKYYFLFRRNSFGFNPCRVFSGLATQLDFQLQILQIPVSIPVGFFQALQRPLHPLSRVVFLGVSIPVGFFQALQRSIV